MKSPKVVTISAVAEGRINGVRLSRATSPTGAAVPLVVGPTMATTRSLLTSLLYALTDSIGSFRQSYTIVLIGKPRIPPFALISSKASNAPSLVEMPNIDAPPDSGAMMPILTSSTLLRPHPASKAMDAKMHANKFSYN